jgi:hypothetical protein
MGREKGKIRESLQKHKERLVDMYSVLSKRTILVPLSAILPSKPKPRESEPHDIPVSVAAAAHSVAIPENLAEIIPSYAEFAAPDDYAEAVEKNTATFAKLDDIADTLAEEGETGVLIAHSDVSPPPGDPAYIPPFEYEVAEDNKLTETQIRKQTRECALKAVLLLLATVLSVVIWFMGATDLQNSETQRTTLLVPQLILFIGVGIASFATLKDGITAIMKRHPNENSMFPLCVLLVLAQTIAGFFTANPVGIGTAALPCVPLLLFLFAGQAFCQLLHCKRLLSALRFCAAADEPLYGVFATKGAGQPAVVHPAPVAFPEKLLWQTGSENPMRASASAYKHAAAKVAPLTILVFVVICGLACGFAAWSALAGLTAAAVAACLCVPLCGEAAFLLKFLPKKKVSATSLVCNSDAAGKIAACKTILCDASEFFRCDGGILYGWKPTETRTSCKALLCACSVANAVGGPLAAVFGAVVQGGGEEGILPAENLEYESGKGYKCRIAGDVVLLGNRACMEDYSVPIGQESKATKKYEYSEYAILYCAINGMLEAWFLLRYAPDTSLRPALDALRARGKRLSVSAFDPAVTPHVLEYATGFSPRQTELLEDETAKDARAQMRTVLDHAAPGVYFRGGEAGYLEALHTCALRTETLRRAQILQAAGSFIGILLLLLAGLTNQIAAAGPVFCICYLLLWTCLSYFAE